MFPHFIPNAILNPKFQYNMSIKHNLIINYIVHIWNISQWVSCFENSNNITIKL